MAITGRIERADGPEARAARRVLVLETIGVAGSGDAAVTIHNISETGLLVETSAALGVGEAIAVDLPEAGPVEAQVVWASGALHGCRFAAPLSRAVLSAAQLRAAVAPVSGDEPVPRRSEALSAGTLGQRIAAARKQRRISLAQVAGALGVSRPTVWAWEQDRARPAPARMAPLAAALGLDEADLASEAGNETVKVAVEAARRQVAVAAGIAPDAVRIFLEL